MLNRVQAANMGFAILDQMRHSISTFAGHLRRLPIAVGCALMVVTAAGVLSSCSSAPKDPSAKTVTVTDAYSNAPVPGQPNAAVFGAINNGTDGEVVLVGASSTVSTKAELHRTTKEADAAMTMSRVGRLTIKPGETVALEPGGLHIMLIGVDPATFPTDTVAVTLSLADGTALSVDAEVRKLASSDVGPPGGSTAPVNTSG